MSHFTYQESDKMDKNSLCQGDIIEVSEEIKEVLSEYHPHFIKDKYKYFIVITQSCDLVRRSGKNCKSPYITLAAVRSYDEFIYRIMKKENAYEECGVLKLLEITKYQKYYQLLERVFNNTEDDYFFLYKDDELGLKESMIAYLKVTVTLKSDLHYDKCLMAKKLELADEFKAKLGWLVGNIYSRVGTTDWTSIKTEKERKQMIKDELYTRFVISDRQHLGQLKQKISEEENPIQDVQTAINYMNQIVIKSNYEQVMDKIQELIYSQEGNIDETEKKKLFNIIKNNVTIRTLIK